MSESEFELTKLDENRLRSAIEELLSRYCRVVDCKDYDKLSDVFATDVKISVVIQNLEFHGVEPFKVFLNKTKPFSEDRMHSVSNLSMRVSATQVRAFSYWKSTMTFKNVPIEEAGFYEMTCDASIRPLKFGSFTIFHKYRVTSNVKSWKEVGFPGTQPMTSEDKDIFQRLKDWF
ncbi:MAG: nuclear transport factor 2 family protein [Nitrososphaerota archaeon]|nr:nuclear transport factor 2 family protein [Nitrososphaerota archaeon]